jgi:guanylate kinase
VAAVESVQALGKVCILDIDVQGVQKVKRSALQPYYVFIAPPSMEELEKRLRGRATENEEQLRLRLQNATKELEYGQAAGNFDRIFVNANLNACVDDLVSVLHEWYPHLIEMVPPPSDDEAKNCTCAIS